MVMSLVAMPNMQASTQDMRSSKRELVSVCQNLYGDCPGGNAGLYPRRAV
jgi:hypothetical protein